MKLDNYPFNGWDYHELALAWNIPNEMGDPHDENFVDVENWTEPEQNEDGTYPFKPDYKIVGPVYDDCEDWFDCDKVIAIYIGVALKTAWDKPWKNGNQLKSRVVKKMAKDLRIYLKELSKGCTSYYGPMWDGMSKIESDTELLRIFKELVGWAWD